MLLLKRFLREPDRIFRELLQPGGVEALGTHRLQHCLDGIGGILVRGYQVIFNGRSVTVPYPLDNYTTARNRGQRPEKLSFQHSRFIRKLRAAASKEPNITIVEIEVDGLIKLEGTNQLVGSRA